MLVVAPRQQWRAKESSSAWNFGSVADYSIRKEYLVSLWLPQGCERVARTRIVCIDRKVNALAPHSVIGVNNVESILFVDYFGVRSASAVPKP